MHGGLAESFTHERELQKLPCARAAHGEFQRLARLAREKLDGLRHANTVGKHFIDPYHLISGDDARACSRPLLAHADDRECAIAQGDADADAFRGVALLPLHVFKKRLAHVLAVRVEPAQHAFKRAFNQGLIGDA